MDPLSIIIGVFATCILLFIFSFMVDEKKHGIVKIFVVFFSLILLIVIPYALIESKHTCEVVVANSTAISDTTTSYEYTTHCYDIEANSPTLLLKIITWFYRIFSAYIFIYLIYWGGSLAIEKYKGTK